MSQQDEQTPKRADQRKVTKATFYKETEKSRKRNVKIKNNKEMQKEKFKKIEQVKEIKKQKTDLKAQLAKEVETAEYIRPTLTPQEFLDADKVELYLKKMEAYKMLMEEQETYKKMKELEDTEKEILKETKFIDGEIQSIEEVRKLGKKLKVVPKPTRAYIEEFGFTYWLKIFMRDISKWNATKEEYCEALLYVTEDYQFLWRDWYDSLSVIQANDFDYLVKVLTDRYPEPMTMKERQKIFVKIKQVIDRFFEYQLQKESAYRKAYPLKIEDMETDPRFIDEFKDGMWKPFLKRLIREDKDELPYPELVETVLAYEKAEIKAVGTYGQDGQFRLIRTREVQGWAKLNLKVSPQELQRSKNSNSKAIKGKSKSSPTQKKGQCKFFQQGTCKKGNNCDWSHATNVNAVQTRRNAAKATDPCFIHGDKEHWIDCKDPANPCHLCGDKTHTEHRCPHAYCRLCGKNGHNPYSHGIPVKN